MISTLMEIPQGNTWKTAENRTLKWGSSPPRAEEESRLAKKDHIFNRFPCRFQRSVKQGPAVMSSCYRLVLLSAGRRAKAGDVLLPPK